MVQTDFRNIGYISASRPLAPQYEFSGNPELYYTSLPVLPTTSHHPPHERQRYLTNQGLDQADQNTISTQTIIKRLISPSLELFTAGTLLLQTPWLKKVINTKTFPQLSKLANPKISNILLGTAVLCRSLFNSSIGINQEQAGMVLNNIAAVALQVPLLLWMGLSGRNGSLAKSTSYTKTLTLINLMLAGLFATGFVQKARHDIGKTHYNHDMRNLKEVTDFKNSLSITDRLKRSRHEIKWLTIDSIKTYQEAWAEVKTAFSNQSQFKTFMNPLKPEGTPSRIAFSAFTMPLGAVIALLNIKKRPSLAFIAGSISLLGNMANGVALALSSWLDKDQPLRWLGVIGGLISPISEGVLTAKLPIGPAAMTSSNAFQNLYQATAWANLNEGPVDPDEPNKKVILNKNHLLPPPQ